MSIQPCQPSHYELKGEKKQKVKVGGLHLLNILPISSEDVHIFSDYKETPTVTYINAFQIPQKNRQRWTST